MPFLPDQTAANFAVSQTTLQTVPHKTSHTALQTARIFTVTEINTVVRQKLQSDPALRELWLEGEIFNLNYHSSGHVYFSLKDSNSHIRCTFFRNANRNWQQLRLENGMQLLVWGSISVYSQRGEYQFNVQRVHLSGAGELHQQIEQLKQLLSKEGLFDPARKSPLPFLPTTLGVATAATGAAIKDIMRTALLRCPKINILLAPCQVQGKGAAGSIATAIEALNRPDFSVDVIIVGRGGGSFEDLYAFNEEETVRAVANSRVPIISAVGHEIDHPLTDLAADAYVATPTAAAEMAIPIINDLYSKIEDNISRLRLSFKNRYNESRQRLRLLASTSIYQKPISILENRWQLLDYLEKNQKIWIQTILKSSLNRFQSYQNFSSLFEKNIFQNKKRYALANERLQNFSPLATLKRGYAIIRKQNRKVVRSSGDVQQGEKLEVLLHEGRLIVHVDQQ